MDPLSLTASIITVIGVGGQLAKAVRRLASLKGAPDLVLALNNEIADLQLVVMAIQDVFEKQQTSGVPFPSNRAGEINVDASITNSLRQANEKVTELEATYKFLEKAISGSNAEFKKVVWLREQKRVRQMQKDFKHIRLKLAAALGVLNSSTLLRLETGVYDIRTQLSNLHTNRQQEIAAQDQRATQQETAHQGLHDEIRRLQMLQQHSETAQGRRLTQQGDAIQEPITRFITAQQRFELKLDNIQAAQIARAAEFEARANTQSSAGIWVPPTHTVSSSSIQVSTFISYCNGCSCICHHRHTWKTPQILERFLGMLFIGYIGIPYISPKCNNQNCIQRTNPMIIMTYLFPSWLLARIFILAVRFSSINGLELNLRVPRVIRSSSAIFDFCIHGDIEGVKALFRQGLGSPFDVNAGSGETPLMYALAHTNIELCQLLLHAGADPYFETSDTRTPIDIAWTKILSGQYDATTREKLRALFSNGDEFFEKQEFNLLHKVVLGFNPLRLETLLASMTKSMIDMGDAAGRTALWWAARRADYNTTSTLIKFRADVNIKSSSGWSAISTAIWNRDQSCVRLLLEHSSRLDIRDHQGWLPLHECSYRGCDLDILKTILTRTGNVDSTTISGKETALMLAAQENYVDICACLISHNADLNMVDSDGENALHIAVRYNRNRVLELLLQNQANPYLKTHAGETLLHYAAQFGDLECLRLLYTYDLSGLNITDKVVSLSPVHTSKNMKGLIALQIAEQRPNMSPEWLAMFQKLHRGIGYPKSKTTEASLVVEEEDFHDALELQD